MEWIPISKKKAGVKKIDGERLLDPNKVVQITMKGIDNNKNVINISFRSKLMALLSNLIPSNIYDSIWFYMMKKLR